MKKYLIPLLLSTAFLVVGLFTLSDYGINWDTPGHLLRGQALTTYLLTGHKNYGGVSKLSPILIKPGERISRYSYSAFETAESPLAKLPERPLPQKEKSSFYQTEHWNGEYFLNLKEGGHLALMDIFSSLSNKLFFGLLGILGDIESYQLVNILVCSLGVFIVAAFAYDVTRGSWMAATVAGLSLGLFPLFFAESHFNMKDPIQAVFYTTSIYSLWNWIRSSKNIWGVAFVVSIILALGVKWNIILLPVILLPWFFLIKNSQKFRSWLNLKLLLFFLLFLVLLFLFIALIASSVVLSPLEKLFWVWDYYWQTGSRTDLLQPKGFILPLGFNIYPLILALTQTPEIILILGGIGVIRVIRGKGGPLAGGLKTGYLLILWMLLPILRFTLPHVWFYSGFRQFMEVIPAMAILAGIGGGYLAERLKSNIKSITFIIIITVILLLPIIKFHPNENAYFNLLVGGLRGAVDKNLVDWTITYGNIYKQGVKWLNENAQKDANLAFLDGSMFAISSLWLRDDISISPDHFSGFEQKGEYIMALFNPLDPPVFAKRYPERFLKPVSEIKVDGVALLFIYKNDKSFLKQGFKNDPKMIKALARPVKGTDRDYFEINLGKDVLVTKISMSGNLDNCFNKDNEMFAFKAKSKLEEKVNLKDVYMSNEKKIENSGVDFLFPAEPASAVLIYPLNNQACSLQSKLFSVSFLEENE